MIKPTEISTTFYNWKKKFGGLGVTELRRLRKLEEENNRLKQIVADLTLDKQMLQEVLKKTSEAAAAKAGSCKTDRGLPGKYQKSLRRDLYAPVRLVLQSS